MPVLPRTDADLLAWVRLRLSAWEADPDSIGLSQAALDDLALALATSSALYDEALAARTAARGATGTWHAAGRALRRQTAGLVASIKAYAERTNNPDVYPAALIEPPRRRSPLGPPPAPQFRGLSMPRPGVMELRWKGTRKGGTIFQIERALATAQTPDLDRFMLLATTTRMVFADRSLPPGTTSLAYRLIAQRSGGSSPPSATMIFAFSDPGGASERGRIAA